jgi:TAT (twin-arginine translocation) pathway signal sequence
MTELTRRHILTAAAATAAAGALAPYAPTAQAAAPLGGRQAPSFYRCKVGEFEVTVVNDGARAIPLPAQFVRNVPNEQVLAAAEAAYMPKGSIIAPFNPIVVNTGAKLVLIDTGYGPGLGPTVGLLPSTLAAAGIDSQGDRHRLDLAPARRPHPRAQDPRRRARLPQRRDQGAGRRLGVLDE